MREVLKPKLSVVVTVYNLEEYIKECLESVISQTYGNMEIIIVNAASTDNSADICRAYAEKYPFITYTECENNGPGHSRNTGIQAATGRYIAFVDGDDLIDKEMYTTLMDIALKEDMDVVYSTCYRFFNDDINNKSIRNIEDITCHSKGEIWQKMILQLVANTQSNLEVPGSMCMSVYRKDIIDKNNLFVRSTKEVYSEDNFFNTEFLSCCSKAKAVNIPLYYYRKRQTSFTNNVPDYAVPALTNFCSRIKKMAQCSGVNREELDKRCKVRMIIALSSVIKNKVDTLPLPQVKAYTKKLIKENNIDLNFEKADLANQLLQVRLFRFLLKYRMYTLLYILVKVYSRFIQK